MMLSILIPTLEERRGMLYVLKRRLDRLAIPYQDEIEILINEDNREKTTGVKRNELIDQAKGRFSAFIDDDDDVPEWYFSSIFNAIKKNPETDCIGFKGLMMNRNHNPQRQPQIRPAVFRHSVGLEYSDGLVNGEYLRPPNHLNPMLTEYFREIRFPDLTFAEDYDFCLRLAQRGLIKNETFLNIIMYHYKFDPNKKQVINKIK